MRIVHEICKEQKTDIKCKDCNGCKTYKNINFACTLIGLKIYIQKHNSSFHSGKDIMILSYDLECNWQDCTQKRAIRKIAKNNYGKIGNIFIKSCISSDECYNAYYKENLWFIPKKESKCE